MTKIEVYLAILVTITAVGQLILSWNGSRKKNRNSEIKLFLSDHCQVLHRSTEEAVIKIAIEMAEIKASEIAKEIAEKKAIEISHEATIKVAADLLQYQKQIDDNFKSLETRISEVRKQISQPSSIDTKLNEIYDMLTRLLKKG